MLRVMAVTASGKVYGPSELVIETSGDDDELVEEIEEGMVNVFAGWQWNSDEDIPATLIALDERAQIIHSQFIDSVANDDGWLDFDVAIESHILQQQRA